MKSHLNTIVTKLLSRKLIVMFTTVVLLAFHLVDGAQFVAVAIAVATGQAATDMVERWRSSSGGSNDPTTTMGSANVD